MLQVGIVGLPNVGKSTLFNTLTSGGAPADNYPFCTVEPNVGIVPVPDPRLQDIHALTGSRESVPTHIRFVDIAGLVEGASRGEGLGNQFLGQIREVDALAHVLRCFENPDVTHVAGSVDPVRDMEIVETELALADLEMVERRQEKVGKKARSGEKDAIREMAVLDRLRSALDQGDALRTIPFSDQDRVVIKGMGLLTTKPVLYIANVPEEDRAAGLDLLESELAVRTGYDGAAPPVIPVSLAIESELALLEPGERLEFLRDLGLDEEGSTRVIHAAYEALGLITFFSSNEKQTTAWAVPRGTRAPEAAGAIHSDFQQGFIRAETIGYREFMEIGSMKEARERGAIRSEGKGYVVSDGDILLFRFNL